MADWTDRGRHCSAPYVCWPGPGPKDFPPGQTGQDLSQDSQGDGGGGREEGEGWGGRAGLIEERRAGGGQVVGLGMGKPWVRRGGGGAAGALTYWGMEVLADGRIQGVRR